MKEFYSVKYRQQGDWFWTRFSDVIGDGIVTHMLSDGEMVQLAKPYRFLLLKDRSLVHLPYDVEIIFGSERDYIIAKEMSKTIGSEVQR